MKGKKRLIAGFIVAPLVSTLIITTRTLLFSSNAEYIWTFLMCLIFGYIVCVILGVPEYLMLRKWETQSFVPYCLVGTVIGLFVYGSIFFPVFIINFFQYGYEHALLTLNNSVGLVVFFVVYGLISAGVFWFIVVNPRNL